MAHALTGLRAKLRFVAEECGDFAVDARGDVDVGIGLEGEEHVQLGDAVGLQTLFEKLREDERDDGAGEDGVRGGLAGGPVIRMVDVPVVDEDRRRIMANDAVRANLADDAGDIAADVERRLKNAIGIAQEDDVLHADDASGAIGDDAVGDFRTFVNPAGDAPGNTEFDIVGVRGDDEDARW